MANLRLKSVSVIDSSTIRAEFSEELYYAINTSNIEITSQIDSIVSPEILKVSVNKKILNITVQYLTPYAQYLISFKSTESSPFKSRNNNYLFEDNKTNTKLILGAEDPNNPFRDILLEYLKDNIYNFDYGTLVRTIINSQSDQFYKSFNDIKYLKNANYLTFDVIDEQKIRGAGPFDRLNEEGAYQILRVGKEKTNTSKTRTLSYSSFPDFPITLQTVSKTETLTIGSSYGTFDKLILNLSKYPVTKVNSITINYQDSTSYEYSISSLGYQLLDPKYDQDYASKLSTLEENQVKLSNSLLESTLSPKSGDEIVIEYEYKLKGRFIDENTVEVYNIQDSIREVCPPIITKFSLKYFPILNDAGEIATSGGVEFLDPESNPPFSEAHPAFLNEITYKIESLPNYPGQYSVDYETGTVYVYGAEINDGTGDFPPVATYKYKNSFISRLDFTYDPTTFELASSSMRDLAGDEAIVKFDYEDVLVSGIDFKEQIHEEALNERIDNRLTSTNSLKVLNTPITNVFRVFNETTGEIYKITRFNKDTVTFTTNVAPKTINVIRERASFSNVLNETLIVSEELTNASNLKIFKILLENQVIMSASDDCIGSSFNSSAFFSNTDIFQTEIYYDNQILTLEDNLDKLEEGKYCINYDSGIVYIGVSNSQDYNIGTVSYKTNTIETVNKHITEVSEVYYSLENDISTRIGYSDFTDTTISPVELKLSDERFLNGDTELPYVVESDTITISDDAIDIRGIYDNYNLQNTTLLNFAENSTVSGNLITLGTLTLTEESVISSGNIVYTTFYSSGIEIANVLSVKRISDNLELFDGGTYSTNQINLTGINSPNIGDVVLVVYEVKLNGSSTPIIDYDRGGFYVDYTYLADEILVSYEFGDNCLDFRESLSIDVGDTYYVSYKVGALRDALLKNFGTLVNISILNNFDVFFERERYRDALVGALQSFTKGPTISSMTSLVSAISHVDPNIVESAFEYWVLGISYLYQSNPKVTGNVELVSGKFDNGISITDGSIKIPASSNIRIEEGTFETWVIPNWNGLDNDADLTFTVYKDDIELDNSSIFIGSYNTNPDSNVFTINKNDALGLPSKIYTNTGMFIFYDEDLARWKVFVKDQISDGYQYTGTIETTGRMYDSKFLPGLGEVNDVLRTFTNKIQFEFNIDEYDGYSPDGYQDGYQDGYYPLDGYVAGYSFDGISFMSDNDHYILDIGDETKNRLSLFKSGEGYLIFKTIDKNKSISEISYDVSDWASGEKHHVAITWKINTSDHRDELHLFVDGFEVPNIIKYGGIPSFISTDRFKTVSSEYMYGEIPLNAVTSNDLITTLGSSIVSSNINFTLYGINPGNQIEILESGFSIYTILEVNGAELVLDSEMPASLSDARFTINQYNTIIQSEVDLTDALVYIVRNGNEEELPGLNATIPAYEFSKNLFNENVLTILGDVEAGDRVLIKTRGLNHRRYRQKHYLWNDTNIIKTQLPPPINLNEAKIYALLLPLTPIGPDNAVYSTTFTATLNPTQPSNDTEGRHLAIRLSGSNVNFSTPVSVTINGTAFSGATSEIVTFSNIETKYSTEKWMTITNVVVVVLPYLNKNSISIEIKEKYPVTYSDDNELYPVIRFSYQTQQGTTLEGSGDTVYDANGYFVDSNVGQLLTVTSPIVGNFTITERVDTNTIKISPNISTITNGVYSIYNINIEKSGFQNGFFTFEEAGNNNTAYTLKSGWYEFDYSTWLEIPFEPLSNKYIYIGSDINAEKHFNGIIDETRILSKQLSDVRTGETIADNEDSITTDFTALQPFKKNRDTLLLLHYDSFPLVNESDLWISNIRNYLQSDTSVNENFSNAIVLDKPLVIENNGYLSTVSEGSIEFWVSPFYDTGNDPVLRFYFDAASIVTEEVTSLSSNSITISSRGTLVSVEAAGKFYDGTIDGTLITLRKALPYQQTPVKVSYIPNGVKGDRISIFKDQSGFVNFAVRGNDKDFVVRQPIFWERNSWHRIRATYKFNRADNNDEIRLFVDGEERGTVMFGSGILFGDGLIFGQGFAGVDNSILIDNIDFKDYINQFVIGGDYNQKYAAKARIDNLRLSNISRQPFMVAGQAKDVNYNSNTDTVYPVVEDLFTTYLLDFDKLKFKNDEFAIIRNEKYGIFNFILNVIDSFDIVKSNDKIKQILEVLVNTLKPAQSKVTINYV